MVLQKLWVSQNFSRISRVSQSRFLAVLCVPQSRFLYEGVSESRFFAKLRVWRPSSCHLILNFIKAAFNFQEKVNPDFS